MVWWFADTKDAASVVTNCFFLSMYDAKSKRWPVPSSKDLVKLQQQVAGGGGDTVVRRFPEYLEM